MNSPNTTLDKFDCAILAALQQDGTLSIAALSEKIGLSSTPCWKRVRRLEEEGYIESRVAIVNRQKVGLPVTVFVSVRTGQHDENGCAALPLPSLSCPRYRNFTA